MLEGLTVVTAEEMARIEKRAIAKGSSEKEFMENAAKAVADVAEHYVEAHRLRKSATLLVGKGNNGGDALAVGRFLLRQGFSVSALHLYPLEQCSPLCRLQVDAFKKAGGAIKPVYKDENFTFDLGGLIIDGIVGTGFAGKAEGIMEIAITAANKSGEHILAIDIPSGLNGSTGEVGSVAIDADTTVYLGLPKIGFFIGSGWDHVGHLALGEYGLPTSFIDEAEGVAYLLNEENMPEILPPIKKTRHKYEAGYVVAVAGSREMPGAAILASYAALRSGAGIVRLFHAKGMPQDGAPPRSFNKTGQERKKL